MKSPLLLFHTIRHLKLRQIVGRVWFLLYSPRPTLFSGVKIRATRKAVSNLLPRTQSLFAAGNGSRNQSVMRFLGEELAIDSPDFWNTSKKAKLFLYNVHYFDDLNAENSQDRHDLHDILIERWIAENPAPLGNGWEPYPLSLRIVNWVQYFNRRGSIPDHWLNSLASQADYLSRKLEYHLLGNHLFTNAKALVFAGCFLHDQDRWTRVGLDILDKEIPEQVLPDGGHFELSPMYHCIAMADLMDLISLRESYPEQISAEICQKWIHTLNGMFMWLDRMRHPDGDISLFNDSALDIAPDYSMLSRYANSLGLAVPRDSSKIHHARDSGYVTLRSEIVTCILDVGRIGADYIPGHAHADSLSFEMSLFGQRLICDSGTSEYGNSEERLRQRGTDAHNTVLVDQQNSSEVWSGFRVARRANPIDISVTSTTQSLEVSAAHTGYRRLKGKNTHRRHWSVNSSGMTIKDSVCGRFKTASAIFHLHPDVLSDESDGDIRLTLLSGHSVSFVCQGGSPHIESATWHPRFGVSISCQRIVVPFEESELTTTLSWKVTGNSSGI